MNSNQITTHHLALPLTHEGTRWSLSFGMAVLLFALGLWLLSRYHWQTPPSQTRAPIVVQLLPEVPSPPVTPPAPAVAKPAAPTPTPAHPKPRVQPRRVPAVKPKPAARAKPQPSSVAPPAPPVEPETASADLQPGPATGLALPSAPEPPPAAPDEANATLRAPSAGDAPAAYLSGTPPVYPEQARRRGWEGTVLLRVQLDADGRVQAVTVLRSSGYPVLDQAAVSQIANWRFKPSLHDGKPQPSALRVPVKFRLEQS